jgi:hypothetical protein
MRRTLPQATSGNGNGDRKSKRNKTAHIGDDAESSKPIACDRWVPEDILMEELCIQKDTSSAKSRKDANNEVPLRLTQQNVYFARELTSKAKPPQPFLTLGIYSFYYLSRDGPRPHKSISIHNWCRLCIAFDTILDSDADNRNYDELIRMKDAITEYTSISIQSSNRHLAMSQLHQLATSLLDENKIIRPSQFEVLALSLPHKKEADDDTTQRFVSPELVDETALSSTAHSQLQQVQSQSIVCRGIASKMLYSILDTNPGMIVKRYSIIAGVIRHNSCSNHLTEGEIRSNKTGTSCASCSNAQKNLRRERDPDIKMQVAPEKEQIANAIRKHYHNAGLDDVLFGDDVEVKWLCGMMAMSHPTTISIDLISGMNLGFCQKTSNECSGFWITRKVIRGNNGIVLCPRCQSFNRNDAKRQLRRVVDKGDRRNMDSKVNLRYLSPASTTERL